MLPVSRLRLHKKHLSVKMSGGGGSRQIENPLRSVLFFIRSFIKSGTPQQPTLNRSQLTFRLGRFDMTVSAGLVPENIAFSPKTRSPGGEKVAISRLRGQNSSGFHSGKHSNGMLLDVMQVWTEQLPQKFCEITNPRVRETTLMTCFIPVASQQEAS